MPELIKYDLNNNPCGSRLPNTSQCNNLLEDIPPYDQQSPEGWAACYSYVPKYYFRRNYAYSKTSIVDPLIADPLFKTWPERKNSFTQSNLFDNSKELFELIRIFKETQFISFRNHLANRLISLFHYAKDEDPLSMGINAESLRFFYRFLHSNINLKCPIITLTPELDIYSTWKEGNGRLFSAHFLPNVNARYVIFMPNPKNPELIDYSSGKTTYDALMQIVARFNLNDLVLD